jgi:thiol-disulfide isomerase/thioredoxin
LAVFAQAQADNYPNGSTVADFTVTDIDGISHTLYNYTAQGKYVVLDFFFTTCPPCQATAPYFNQLNETYGCNAHDLICLTINDGQDNTAAVAAYEAAHGGMYAHCPAVSNEGGGAAVTSTFGVNAFPTYCLIGPDNVMIAHDMWPIGSMADFVAYFPGGNAIQPAACATGIPEHAITGAVSVHPSPSNGRMTVDASGMGFGNVTMEVFDVLGQHVRSIPLGGMANGLLQTDVDLSELGDGQYLCRFLSSNGRQDVRRVVIAH